MASSVGGIGDFPDWSTVAAREQAKRIKREVDQKLVSELANALRLNLLVLPHLSGDRTRDPMRGAIVSAFKLVLPRRT